MRHADIYRYLVVLRMLGGRTVRRTETAALPDDPTTAQLRAAVRLARVWQAVRGPAATPDGRALAENLMARVIGDEEWRTAENAVYEEERAAHGPRGLHRTLARLSDDRQRELTLVDVDVEGVAVIRVPARPDPSGREARPPRHATWQQLLAAAGLPSLPADPVRRLFTLAGGVPRDPQGGADAAHLAEALVTRLREPDHPRDRSPVLVMHAAGWPVLEEVCALARPRLRPLALVRLPAAGDLPVPSAAARPRDHDVPLPLPYRAPILPTGPADPDAAPRPWRRPPLPPIAAPHVDPPGPGRVRLDAPGALPAEGVGSWQHLSAALRRRPACPWPVDLVCAVEMPPGPGAVGSFQQRIDAVGAVVAAAHTMLGGGEALRVGLIGYGCDDLSPTAPAVRRGVPDRTPRVPEPLGAARDFEAFWEHVPEELAAWPWRAGSRRVLLTVGSRPPRPVGPPDREALSGLRARGVVCLVLYDRSGRAEEGADGSGRWRSLGADGLFTAGADPAEVAETVTGPCGIRPVPGGGF